MYRYAESADFLVLLIGYSLDNRPVSVVDLASGETVSAELLTALLWLSVEKRALTCSDSGFGILVLFFIWIMYINEKAVW